MYPDGWEKSMAPNNVPAQNELRTSLAEAAEHNMESLEPRDRCDVPMTPKEWKADCEHHRRGWEAQERAGRIETTHTFLPGDPLG